MYCRIVKPILTESVCTNATLNTSTCSTNLRRTTIPFLRSAAAKGTVNHGMPTGRAQSPRRLQRPGRDPFGLKDHYTAIMDASNRTTTSGAASRIGAATVLDVLGDLSFQSLESTARSKRTKLSSASNWSPLNGSGLKCMKSLRATRSLSR